MNLIVPLGIGAALAYTVAALDSVPMPEGYEYGPTEPLGANSDPSPWGWEYGPPTPPLVYAGDPDANVRAFLAVLRAGESGGNYGALVGGGSFTDYSHHPGWTDASMTKKSAWAGRWNSHAAGAYQFQPGTFKLVSDQIGLRGDFSIASQDAAAIQNLKRKGALDLIRAGNVQAAWSKLLTEWTSLHDRGLAWTVSTFQNNGGYA